MTDAPNPHLTLPDGCQLALEYMRKEHLDAVVGFAKSLPEEDLLFLSMDITKPKVVKRWIKQIEKDRTRSLLAFDGERLVGYANVHRNPTPWLRRTGEIRVNIAPDFRSRGLGRLLIHRAFDLARDMELKKIIAQMTADQRSAQGVFRKLGFVPEAILADFVIDRNGSTRDLVMMTFDVDGHTDQAGDAVMI